MSRKRTAVLISGRGSNMAALIAAAAAPTYPAEIALVLSDRPDAAGLAYARDHGINAYAVDRKAFPSKAAFEGALQARLVAEGIDLIALAGFMRLLSPAFVERWRDRLINIHPSLLPLFPGLDTHARALAAGVRIHGCTVHFVRAETDSGPIIIQAAVPVLPGDDESSLAARVLKAEHLIYPEALRLVASGLVTVAGERAVMAGAVAETAAKGLPLIVPAISR